MPINSISLFSSVCKCRRVLFSCFATNTGGIRDVVRSKRSQPVQRMWHLSRDKLIYLSKNRSKQLLFQVTTTSPNPSAKIVWNHQSNHIFHRWDTDVILGNYPVLSSGINVGSQKTDSVRVGHCKRMFPLSISNKTQ